MSYHNYILEIPIDKVIHVAENMSNYHEMAKTLKIKNKKDESFTLTDLKGKLFTYFKIYTNLIKTDCPQKGIRCSVNQVSKNFFLNNTPFYLSISLKNEIKSISQLLNLFVMIPNILELATIFKNSSNNKIFYELLGCICLSPNKNYTCFFKQTTKWVHYYDEVVTVYDNFFNMASHCLKNGEVPTLLIYQMTEKYSYDDSEMTTEEIYKLEQYAKNMDNMKSILRNKFKPEEDCLETLPDELERNIKNKRKNSENGSRNNSSSFITVYNCVFCGSKNNIEDILCIKCKKNNEKSIENIKKKNVEVKVLKRNSSKSTLNNDEEKLKPSKRVVELEEKKSYNTASKFYPKEERVQRESRERAVKDYNLPKQMVVRKDKSPDTRKKMSGEVTK
jgi:hypothetical protein